MNIAEQLRTWCADFHNETENYQQPATDYDTDQFTYWLTGA